MSPFVHGGISREDGYRPGWGILLLLVFGFEKPEDFLRIGVFCDRIGQNTFSTTSLHYITLKDSESQLLGTDIHFKITSAIIQTTIFYDDQEFPATSCAGLFWRWTTTTFPSSRVILLTLHSFFWAQTSTAIKRACKSACFPLINTSFQSLGILGGGFFLIIVGRINVRWQSPSVRVFARLHDCVCLALLLMNQSNNTCRHTKKLEERRKSHAEQKRFVPTWLKEDTSEDKCSKWCNQSNLRQQFLLQYISSLIDLLIKAVLTAKTTPNVVWQQLELSIHFPISLFQLSITGPHIQKETWPTAEFKPWFFSLWCDSTQPLKFTKHTNLR